MQQIYHFYWAYVQGQRSLSQGLVVGRCLMPWPGLWLQLECSIHLSSISSELKWLGEVQYLLVCSVADISICREEFKRHGLEGVVTLTCRDVCVEGFGMEDIADAGNIIKYQH